MYYVDKGAGTFGLLTIDHALPSSSELAPPSSRSPPSSSSSSSSLTFLPLVTDLTSPTRVALSGSSALTSLYSSPLPPLLPSTDEASSALNVSLSEHHKYLLDRAMPRVFVLAGLDEDDQTTVVSASSSSSTSSSSFSNPRPPISPSYDYHNDINHNPSSSHPPGVIHVFTPSTSATFLLAVGLPSPRSLTCTPSSDLLWLDSCTVRKPNSSLLYTATCVKCIPGRDVMDHVASSSLIPSSLHRILLVLPPSLAGSAVAVALGGDGTVLVACARARPGPDSSASGESTARHESSSAGGCVVSFAPVPLSSSSSSPSSSSPSSSSSSPSSSSSLSPSPSSSSASSSSFSSTPCHPHFDSLNLGREPRLTDLYTYDPRAPTVLHSDTPIISDLSLSAFTGELVVAGSGGGPFDVRPPAVAILSTTPEGASLALPLTFGFAESLTIGGGPGFSALPPPPSSSPFSPSPACSNWPSNYPLSLSLSPPSPFVPSDFLLFYLVSNINGTSLLGLYSTQSLPSLLFRTREAATVKIPATPRPLTPRASLEDDDEESVASSIPEADEDLFNDLSDALAAEDGDRELAKRAAMLDPSLSKTGNPVNVKVVLRCRPLLKPELAKMIPSAVRCTRNSVTVDGSFLPGKADKTFTFDRVFPPEATQRQVFAEAVAPIVHRVLDGFKCTVFAYGQTGSGKTYSMEGEAGSKGADYSGLIPRAVHSLFDELDADLSCKYTMTASHMEIYLENPYDLLASESAGGKWSAGSHMKQKLTIQENYVGSGGDDAIKSTTLKGAGGVNIIGLSEVVVKKPSDIFKIMHRTKQNRHSAETLCNRASSRSHAIFSINVTLTKRAEGGGQITRRGRLHLVDLSGSESIKKSGAEGIHAQEAAVIGKSLLSLGRVIRSLVAKDTHVPYRESKLTRILSDSLGGSSYTALVLAITPNSKMVGETMSTLSYGMLARNVTNTPKSDVKFVAKRQKRVTKDAFGNVVEVEEEGSEEGSKEGEVIGADGLDEDGMLKSLNGEKLNGKALSTLLAVAHAPWRGSVPIRARVPGEKNSRTGERVPVGNAKNTPRVFHGETVEWAKLILSGGDGGDGEGGVLSVPARNAFCEIFDLFDYRGEGMLKRDQIQAMDFFVGEESASPQAEEFLKRFWRDAKNAAARRSSGKDPSSGGGEYGRVNKGAKGHMNLEAYLKFIKETAVDDPLAVRTILYKAGYTLSFGKIEKGGDDAALIAGGTMEGDASNPNLMTEAQRRTILEEEERKEKRDKKHYSANSLKSDKAASRSKVAYEALEKIKEIANKDEDFDLKAAFKKFDLDGDGTVDHGELKAVIEKICEREDDKGKVLKVARWEMDAIIELFDPNDDGVIDYAEFSFTFFNRRALVSKDSGGGVGVGVTDGGLEGGGGGGGGGGKNGKKKKKKKDPDPVMPPPPKSAGFVKLSDVFGGDDLIEFTPRDEKGFVIVKKKKNGEDGGGDQEEGEEEEEGSARGGGKASSSTARTTARSTGRRPLSALNVRDAVSRTRTGAGASRAGAERAKTAGGGGGGGGGRAARQRQEVKKEVKPRDWQEWVIKSRNTWMKEAARPAGTVVDLRGAGKPMATQQNASHPRMPKLW